jgi:hypothetical protein
MRLVGYIRREVEVIVARCTAGMDSRRSQPIDAA